MDSMVGLDMRFLLFRVSNAGMQWDTWAKPGVPVLLNWMLDTYCFCFVSYWKRVS